MTLRRAPTVLSLIPRETRPATLRLSREDDRITLIPMSVPTRILLALTIGVIATMLLFSAAVYGDLPAQIPTHFNAAGVPDAFGPRTHWWWLPAISAASSALTVGMSLMIPRRPALLNLPSKPEILALPLDAQIAVVRQAQPGLMALGLLTAAVFLYLQYAVWDVAQGHRTAGIGNLIFILPVVSIALLPAILIPVTRELRRQQQRLSHR